MPKTLVLNDEEVQEMLIAFHDEADVDELADMVGKSRIDVIADLNKLDDAGLIER